MEVKELNFDVTGNLVDKTDKILLIDFDTMIYTACLQCEREEILLPKSFYTKEEWENIINNPTYDSDNNSIREIDYEEVDELIQDKLNYVMDRTGTSCYEAHLTLGQDNFRYDVYPKYKANRVKNRTPAGLSETKRRWIEKEPYVYGHKEIEADDAVVAKYRAYPDRYILCAMDKDVLYSVEGKHFNYYVSLKYDIDMRWVEVSKEQVERHKYMQCLIGDTVDNIKGCKGIGKKRALKLLDSVTPDKYFEVTLKTFLEKGHTEEYFIQMLNLVDMSVTKYSKILDKYIVKLHNLNEIN